jgi:hypothetical protein
MDISYLQANFDAVGPSELPRRIGMFKFVITTDLSSEISGMAFLRECVAVWVKFN